MADRVARLVLWGAAGYGVLGAVLAVYAHDVTGRGSWMRVGAGLVLLAGVAVAGLRVSSPRVRVEA